MSAVTFSKTSRGGDVLTFEGYDYLRSGTMDNMWRCRKIRLCHTTATYIDGVFKHHSARGHNHAPNELIETEIVQEEMDGAVVEEPTSKKRRTGSAVVEPVSVEDGDTEFPIALLPKEESPSFVEAPKYPTARRSGTYRAVRHAENGRASRLSAPSSSTPKEAVEDGSSPQQILSSVRVGTFEEERFVQYICAVLGMVDPAHKRRYMQTIKYTISKLDMDIVNSDPELQSFLG